MWFRRMINKEKHWPLKSELYNARHIYDLPFALPDYDKLMNLCFQNSATNTIRNYLVLSDTSEKKVMFDVINKSEFLFQELLSLFLNLNV